MKKRTYIALIKADKISSWQEQAQGKRHGKEQGQGTGKGQGPGGKFVN